jgi:hypothetical protein
MAGSRSPIALAGRREIVELSVMSRSMFLNAVFSNSVSEVLLLEVLLLEVLLLELLPSEILADREKWRRGAARLASSQCLYAVPP